MSNKIRNPILIISSIVFLLWLTQYALQSSMKAVKYDTVGKINAVVAQKLDVNLSIWGASTAYVNFNPKLIVDSMNLTAFNMGIDGTNIDQYNGLLVDYLAYSQNSQYLIIALDIHGGLVQRNEFYEQHNWLHHFDNEAIYNCHRDIDTLKMYKMRYVPFYPIINYDKHTLSYLYQTISKPTEAYNFPKLGYKPKKNTAFAPATNKETKATFEAIVSPRVWQKLQKSCQLAIQKNIKPIVVLTPCFVDGQKQISNIKAYKNKLFELKKQGVEVYDFLDCSLSQDSRYFVDNTHLNSEGADSLTLLLINRLKAELND